MPAPEGNTNAEKWTEETTLETVEKIHAWNVDNKYNYHLGLSLIENDLYPQWWSEMTEKFKENSIVSSVHFSAFVFPSGAGIILNIKLY